MERFSSVETAYLLTAVWATLGIRSDRFEPAPGSCTPACKPARSSAVALALQGAGTLPGSADHFSIDYFQ